MKRKMGKMDSRLVKGKPAEATTEKTVTKGALGWGSVAPNTVPKPDEIYRSIVENSPTGIFIINESFQ
jgi:hypothetical protein